MAGAYYEKIARINLTTGEIKVEPLDLAKARKFIGGRGLGTKILYDEGVATVDPLSADNKLIYITGPMTGATAPSTGRYMVVTKSPLTGLIACSNSGGIWGSKLKYAGWDAIIVEGEAPDWTYISIEDDQIKLHCAKEYEGMKSEAIDETLKAKHGEECSVLNIGPAGEKKVLLASIMNDKDRAAGRSGVGAVMGSKKLKAIVVKATRKSLDNIADIDALKAATLKSLNCLKANPVTSAGLRQLGTAVLVNIVNNIGSLPTRNWQEAYYDKGEDISGETLAEKYLVKPSACHRCPIACGRVVNINGKIAGGPEYEPLWAYGANCGNNDLNVIDECNMLCNEYGLDAISTPCTIAAAMELYQRGAIKEEECDGAPLEWGSTKALIEWTKRMGDPKPELDWLMSSGSARLCEHYGMPEVSMSVKKQEMPAYDARGIQGIGITYATSNRGGCHVRGYMISPEVLGLPQQLDRTVTDDKAAWAKTFQDLTAVIDSMGHCLFTSFAMGAQEYTDLLNAATGTNYTAEEVLAIGDRIYNIERMFNKAAGMKPEEDRLPKRLLQDPIPSGPSEGMVSKLPLTLPQYYEARGWVNAFPTDETLKKLGLDECIGK
ncbi:MAG: aldehyde ferredoxin oxidoreductase family protein [Christensenellales bacterium]|nr:aldehyde ferredoxin oxidoreductase family protein [Christensenellales bacterium]